MTGWMPIETAPKDGTDVLAVAARGLWMAVVSFDDNPDHPDHVWLTLDGPSYHKTTFTHWQPLPEPPQ